jgi:phosphoesterase family protein
MVRSKTRSPRIKARNRKAANTSAAKPAVKSLKPAGASARSGTLPPIECVVVLMQENRAFDHLFGTWPAAAGIGSGPYANRPDPSLPAGAGNLAIRAGQPAQFSIAQGQGPGHSLDDTNVQLFTSASVRKLFGINGALTRRDAGASSFEELFLGTPRSDTPALLTAAAAPAALDATRAAPDDFMSEMAVQWRCATAGLPGAGARALAPRSQDEVHRFLRSQIQLFLDYRARQGVSS